MDMPKGYIKDVGVSPRPMSVKDRSRDMMFRVRTMSAPTNKSSHLFRQYSDSKIPFKDMGNNIKSDSQTTVNALIQNNSTRRQSLPTYKRTTEHNILNINKLVLFELKFYYGKDERVSINDSVQCL